MEPNSEGPAVELDRVGTVNGGANRVVQHIKGLADPITNAHSE